MKKRFLLLACILIIVVSNVKAQRYAIIDTKYILSKIPEYVDADKKLQLLSDTWQKELDDKQAELDKLNKDFEVEQYMLSDELKKKREAEIAAKEKEIRDLQKKRFGYDGDLFKQKQRLVKPIQDKIFTAIQKIAVARSFDFILDKSEGITVIFADPKLDRSDEVLREMGIKIL